ncbi:hypothetical protein ACLVWU_16060 [Bdellovibrio sp. HCB290]|uniref:hypothetical protein n=1 Tax=Bdellovibrio sp. HCB290 TaxID=3394356 RepID=UPI0039B40618
MRTPIMILAMLFVSGSVSWAAPMPSHSDELINEYSNSPEAQRASRAPNGMFKRPGVMPCPDQSQITKMNDLAKLENHSKDCKPSSGGALRIDQDQPDGEVRGSEVPSQFH